MCRSRADQGPRTGRVRVLGLWLGCGTATGWNQPRTTEAVMTEQNPNPVVVAVGHDAIDAALTYAASEAGRAACGLHLVHVVLPQGPSVVVMDVIEPERLGRRTLNAALDRVR